jgi:long-chain acyl-CoA synthetase
MFDFDLLKSVTIPQLLKRVCERYGPKPAFYSFREGSWSSLTYSELGKAAEGIAAGLLSLGHSRSSKIALLSENSPEWCQAYLGILAMGATVVPIDPLLKPNELAGIIGHSESEAIFISGKCLDTLDQLLRAGVTFKSIILLDGKEASTERILLARLIEKGSASAQRLPATSNVDLAALIYTSGTTGNPKGVMLTHKNILSDIWGIFKVLKLYSGDKFLSVMPLHHTFEATCGFLVALTGGASIVYSRSLKSKELAEDMKTNGITIMLGVPLLFEKFWLGLTRNLQSKPWLTKLYFGLGFNLGAWLPKSVRHKWGRLYFSTLRKKAGLESVRLMICGGAPLPPEIPKNFDILGIKFLQGYGLTESSPVLSLNPEQGYGYASIGLPIAGAELKINDPDPDGIGEILAKGEMVMAGYYRNPEETARVLKEGWLYTGDSGWKNKAGFLYVTGRLKNVIVTRAGKNVYPEEIERELLKSPYIAEALVVGREIPGGEEVYAIIVPDYETFQQEAQLKGMDYNDQSIEESIRTEISICCHNLADYKRIKGFEIRKEELEKTSTRKIKRFLVKSPGVRIQPQAIPRQKKEVRV